MILIPFKVAISSFICCYQETSRNTLKEQEMSRSPTAAPTVSTPSTHLSYPSFDTEPESAASTSEPRPRQVLKDRLYVGNFHPTVDEYVLGLNHSETTTLMFLSFADRHTLIQIFSKLGKLSHLDYLFHKTGPMKGRPRGYAFIEYCDQAVSSCFQS